MKKTLKLFLPIMLMLFILTGCVSINYEITLKEDGTGTVAYIYGIEKSYLEEMETSGEEMTEEMKKNAKSNGYTIESYSDDQIEGFKATKAIKDLSEMSLEEAFGKEYITDSENNKIKLEKKGNKTIFSQNAIIDLTKVDSSMATMKYTIKLPEKVGENNAQEVSEDGKTLTWNLKAGEKNEIKFKSLDSKGRRFCFR